MKEDSLNALFSGLTGTKENAKLASTNEKAPMRSRQKKQEASKNEERFCTIVNSDLLKKVRIIALREGLQSKDIVNAALSKAVHGYERKNGTITEQPKKKASDII